MDNRKGQGIFLGVVGVATLVVAIIGATFAYFSAAASTNEGDIGGQTLGSSGGVLSLTVEKVWTTPQGTASSLDLVPSNVDFTTSGMLQGALDAKCSATSGVNSDTTVYTGCHVYRITVTSTSDIAGVDLNLESLTSDNTHSNDASWKYGFFTATETVQGTLTGANIISGKTGTMDVTTQTAIVEDQALDTNNNHTFTRYLIVYVANAEQNQNNNDENDVTGSYSGTISAAAAGGSTVKASFTAAQG